MEDEADIIARLRLYSQRMADPRSTVLGLLLANSADEIERLRAERDEARRKICEIESQCICDPPRSPQKYASLFGWDCFKETSND